MIQQNAFWVTTLAGKNNFRSAMEYYRGLFRSIANCNTPQCRCVNDEIRLFDYNFYFLNDRNYKEMVDLIEPVKTKYRPRSIERVNMDPFVQRPFDTNISALANFVLEYDWANALSIHYYDEVQSCLLSKNIAQIQEATNRCGSSSFLTADETAIACILKQYSCPIEVKNYMTLGFVIQLPDPAFDSVLEQISLLTGTSNGASPIGHLGSSFAMLFTLLITSFIYTFGL